MHISDKKIDCYFIALAKALEAVILTPLCYVKIGSNGLKLNEKDLKGCTRRHSGLDDNFSDLSFTKKKQEVRSLRADFEKLSCKNCSCNLK